MEGASTVSCAHPELLSFMLPRKFWGRANQIPALLQEVRNAIEVPAQVLPTSNISLALFEAFCIVLLTSNIIFYHMKRHFSLLTSLTTGRHTTYTSHI